MYLYESREEWTTTRKNDREAYQNQYITLVTKPMITQNRIGTNAQE